MKIFNILKREFHEYIVQLMANQILMLIAHSLNIAL